jgi:hypothetical protein
MKFYTKPDADVGEVLQHLLVMREKVWAFARFNTNAPLSEKNLAEDVQTMQTSVSD